MKINSLTKEQESRFPEFVDKWTRIGLSTEPLRKDSVVSALDSLYRGASKTRPSGLIFCTSPLAVALVRAVIASVSSVRDSVLASVLASVRDSVSASVSASVRDSVLASVRDSVSASVRASVRDSVLASVLASVSASVRDSVSASVLASVSASVLASVSASVRDSVRDSVLASVLASVRDYWYGFGQFEAYWLSYYDFVSEVFGCDTSKLVGNRKLCLSAGWSLLFWDWAIISERPLAIHRSGNNLHRDGGLAVEYSDGFGVYALNGIRMKREYVETPSEQLTPETVLAEPNADIRRELLRKVGIERMLAKLPHRVMHKRGNYEVLSVRLSEQVSDARYLKMVNPSIGVHHMEGVPVECDTVEKSLTWRNSNWHKDAEVLT